MSTLIGNLRNEKFLLGLVKDSAFIVGKSILFDSKNRVPSSFNNSCNKEQQQQQQTKGQYTAIFVIQDWCVGSENLVENDSS